MIFEFAVSNLIEWGKIKKINMIRLYNISFLIQINYAVFIIDFLLL